MQTANGEWLVGRVNRARWLQGDIVHVVLGSPEHHKGDVYDEADGRDALSVVDQLVTDHERVFCLTDIRGVRNTTARVLRLPSHPKTTRLALLIGGPVGRMLGNAYLGITKQRQDTKLFSDEHAAIAWLREAKDSAS
ncbi:MAG: hypothetical protein ACPGU1_06945 [Myxococcota bacterium]